MSREARTPMSVFAAGEPACRPQRGEVDLLITPRSRDLGGFEVRRALPAAERRTVGPFIFFDEMGPASFPPGEGINVRPHPHIGLATVTFLFEGAMLHRDSLGFVQPIEPGAVNLMTAGRGIVHSERTPEPLLGSGQRLHGIQTWMALPEDREEMEPAFAHYPATDLPTLASAGTLTTVIIGEAYGARSPVRVQAETLYLSQRLDAGAATDLADAAERAVYVVSGAVRIGACRLEQHRMGVVREGRARIEAEQASHVMVMGGQAIGQRHIWWNFVHSSQARIDQAKQAWRDGAFAPVPGDDEFIPLPND